MIVLQHLDSCCDVLQFFFCLSLWGGGGEKDEKVKLICFFDKAVKKHIGPLEYFNSLSPFLIFLRGE